MTRLLVQAEMILNRKATVLCLMADGASDSAVHNPCGGAVK